MASLLIQILKPSTVRDGAGVKISRVFGFHETDLTDPFLLLDYFGSDNPADYEKGFPWHPHRGMETVTYMMAGIVEHGDSLGNRGRLGPGDIQWMTAGSGIIHQEMPKRSGDGKMYGFQLWVNLPRKDKMIPPRYQEFAASSLPVVESSLGTVKVIAGEYEGQSGPVREISIRPVYLDIHLFKGQTITVPVEADDKLLIFAYEGTPVLHTEKPVTLNSRELAVLKSDGVIQVSCENPCRFILIAGTPLGEPVAWGGPIVMNTREELDQAFRELDDGTFIRKQ